MEDIALIELKTEVSFSPPNLKRIEYPKNTIYMKTLTIILIGLLIIGLLILSLIVEGFFLNNHKEAKMENQEDSKLYQGPVPEGYDEQYFRETGITKPLENK